MDSENAENNPIPIDIPKINIESDNVIINFISKYGFNHIKCDEDGLYNGLIVPKTHANYLFWTSCLTFISGLYGLYKKQYNFAILPLGIFVASINYWVHPVNNWRRYLDISYASFALITHSILAYGLPNFNYYIIILSLSCLCYPVSFYFQEKFLPLSTFSHSLIHIGGNIANIILYSNTI
jgi:hypothetical protein